MFKETKLLQASLADDRDAFESIIKKYQATICAITFSGTGRVDVSEELAQETFVNAWEHLHQLRDLKGFRSWLYSIARHALCNYHRRKKPASLDADLEEVTTEDTQNPPEILMRQEEQMMLEQAIMRLPVKYREPLVLFCRQQQSIRQTAEVLGLSEATVRTRSASGLWGHGVVTSGTASTFTSVGMKIAVVAAVVCCRNINVIVSCYYLMISPDSPDLASRQCVAIASNICPRAGLHCVLAG
jgi:RNA polymerase sigma factor (sigma-70 family)